MSTTVRRGVIRVTCDEPGCSACAFGEASVRRWSIRWGLHKCPKHRKGRTG